MKNLKALHEKLPKRAIMSEEDLLKTIGGQRYETTSYSKAISVCQQLWYHGYRYSVSQHNGKYCIEW